MKTSLQVISAQHLATVKITVIEAKVVSGEPTIGQKFLTPDKHEVDLVGVPMGITRRINEELLFSFETHNQLIKAGDILTAE